MSIPSISTNAVKQATPFAGVYRHGDTLVYDTFTISSLVDEDLRVFEETHNWLRALTKPQEYEQYKRFYNKDQKLYHDGVLTINTNANNPNLRISLKNCHPVTLGMIPLDIKGTAEQTMTVDITFQYDYYIIERINQ